MRNELLKGLPYVVGAGILFPLLLMLANFIFYSGNRATNEQVESYIKNSKIDTVFVPKEAVYKSESITWKLARGSGSYLDINTRIFYSDKYKKYLILYDFNIGDNHTDRDMLLDGGASDGVTITARINQRQLNSLAYGTKENPVPVFPIDYLGPYGIPSVDDFRVTDNMTKDFVFAYLNRVIKKEELEKMFKNEK